MTDTIIHNDMTLDEALLVAENNRYCIISDLIKAAVVMLNCDEYYLWRQLYYKIIRIYPETNSQMLNIFILSLAENPNTLSTQRIIEIIRFAADFQHLSPEYFRGIQVFFKKCLQGRGPVVKAIDTTMGKIDVMTSQADIEAFICALQNKVKELITAKNKMQEKIDEIDHDILLQTNMIKSWSDMIKRG